MWAIVYSRQARGGPGGRHGQHAGSLKSASVQANGRGLAAEAGVADPKGRQDPASFEELQNFCEKRFNRK